MEREVVELSGLGLLNCLPGFIETLEGQLHVGEIYVWSKIVGGKVEAFAICLHSLFVLSLFGVHVAEIEVCPVVAGIAGNPLLIGVRGFV